MSETNRTAPFCAVLFDWDGTVADTGPGIFNSVRYAARHFGLPEKTDEDLQFFIGPPLYVGFEHVYGVSPEESNELTDTYRVYYRKTGIFECNIYDGVRDLLTDLRHAGIRTAVVSSKPKEFLDRLVDHFDLTGSFDAVVGPEMHNHNANKTRMVNQALEELGLPPENVAMVGDRHYDMKGAKGAGVTAVGILYGYGEEEELKAAGADIICSTVKDLSDRLLRG